MDNGELFLSLSVLSSTKRRFLSLSFCLGDLVDETAFPLSPSPLSSSMSLWVSLVDDGQRRALSLSVGALLDEKAIPLSLSLCLGDLVDETAFPLSPSPLSLSTFLWVSLVDDGQRRALSL
ncbi:hypothetical protein F2Q69_00051550 [Brassica cretica]|uniref:Uncharacterized protein n=1 Tax=Brassica cretica TaxID=69181 RepID=A0A8S9PYM9_BRACR|nr:hypothetical protein F2Q69_00051550 [Brassica cretica]